jgi:hypothetical protein
MLPSDAALRANSTIASCTTTVRTSVSKRRSFPALTNSSMALRGAVRRGVSSPTRRSASPCRCWHRLGYAKRAACVVSGDSARRAKPAAQPMQLACSLLARDPARCLYVGDDLRDIQAGRAAGMATVAVRYGYLGDGDPIESLGRRSCCRSRAGNRRPRRYPLIAPTLRDALDKLAMPKTALILLPMAHVTPSGPTDAPRLRLRCANRRPICASNWPSSSS